MRRSSARSVDDRFWKIGGSQIRSDCDVVRASRPNLKVGGSKR